VKKQLGDRYVVFWLDEKKVLEKFKGCRSLSRALERISCSLDTAERLLGSGIPLPGPIVQALKDAEAAAVVVKNKHGVAEDKSAYNMERGARDLAERVRMTGQIDMKAANRLKAGIATLRTKAALLEKRVPDFCGLRTFEGIAKPPKDF